MGIREETIREAIQLGYIEEGETLNFTCDKCDDVGNCLFVYDLYNTDGDCLMEK